MISVNYAHYHGGHIHNFVSTDLDIMGIATDMQPTATELVTEIASHLLQREMLGKVCTLQKTGSVARSPAVLTSLSHSATMPLSVMHCPNVKDAFYNQLNWLHDECITARPLQRYHQLHAIRTPRHERSNDPRFTLAPTHFASRLHVFYNLMNLCLTTCCCPPRFKYPDMHSVDMHSVECDDMHSVIRLTWPEEVFRLS